MTSSTIQQVPCSFHEVRFSPPTAPCPRCRQEVRRAWEATRIAIDAALDEVALLRVWVGVYRCHACRQHFRAQPPFLRPGASYTNRVVAAAVHAVFSDGMASCRVPARLARDLRVRPSATVIRDGCRTFAAGQTLGDDYTAWIVQSFSGVLCVDEVYLGDLALLVAVDPGAPDGDRLVGYELVQGSVQQPAVQGFLERLRDVGIAPAEVVTDGSALYPEVVARVWPQAAHQLCLFHETRRLLRAAMAITPEVRAALPIPPRRPNRAGALLRRVDPQAPSPDDRDARIALVRRLRAEGAGVREITRRTGHSRNTIRAWLRGTVLPTEERTAPLEATSRRHTAPEPPPPAGWASWDQVRCFRQRLKSHRWSVVARLQHLSEADRAVVTELLESPVGAPLRIVHRWAQDWYAIWHDDAGRRRSVPEARECFVRWREDAEAGTLAGLRQVQRRMTDERFASLSHFLRDPRWEATSNGAERAGRSFRHRQGAHYNLRSTVAIGALMDDAAHERRHARSPAAELAVGRSRRGRLHERTEEELAAAA